MDGGMLEDCAWLEHPIEFRGGKTPGIQRQLLDAVQALDWGSGRVLFRHASWLQKGQWRVATGGTDAWRGDEPPRWVWVDESDPRHPKQAAGVDDHTSRGERGWLRRSPGVRDREFERPRLGLARPTRAMNEQPDQPQTEGVQRGCFELTVSALPVDLVDDRQIRQVDVDVLCALERRQLAAPD